MKRAWLTLALALGSLYFLLALGVQAGLFRAFDYESILVLQALVPRAFDLPFSLLSLLGSFELTTIYVLALLYLFFRPRRRIQLFALFLLILLVEVLGKLVIDQPGPPGALHRYVILFSMPTGQVSTPFAFPSGHAARSAFLTVLVSAGIMRSTLAHSTKRTLLLLLLAMESVMLISRVYLADHWATDVIGGALLGTLMALPAFAAEETSPQPDSLDRTSYRG
ncbi:MAG: phosphatase PAP2 family protein [Chloroflexi bacterium]|nr:phosphatase PAP2 family protein [Chloroflexota bacterium]